MSRFTNSTYLLQDQYRDGARLDARIALHERFTTNPYGWHRWLFDQLPLAPGLTVLEVGCGSGALWLKNLDRLPAGCVLLLSDMSPGMVEGTRTALHKRGMGPRFAVLDVQALPLRAASVDLVIANHMLYHVPDVHRALAEIRRVLRPGGRLIAATNGFAHLRALDPLIARLTSIDERHDDAERFGLETGPPILLRHFSSVEVLRYEDALAVTESGPLIDYVLSVVPPDGAAEAALRDLRSHVDDVIAREGAFHLSKDAGILAARP